MRFIILALALLLTYTVHKLRQLDLRIRIFEEKIKQIEYGALKENQTEELEED